MLQQILIAGAVVVSVVHIGLLFIMVLGADKEVKR